MSLIVILFKGGVQLRTDLSVGYQVDAARRDTCGGVVEQVSGYVLFWH